MADVEDSSEQLPWGWKLGSTVYMIALSLCTMSFLSAPVFSLSDFLKGFEGVAESVERGHGLYRVNFVGGGGCLWSVLYTSHGPPVPGDRLQKRRFSFSYKVNGKRVLEYTDAMALVFKLPPAVMGSLLLALLALELVYYRAISRSPVAVAAPYPPGKTLHYFMVFVLCSELMLYVASAGMMVLWTS